MLQPKIVRGDYNTYQGMIICYNGRDELWREKTGISRTNINDAWNDANIMINELLTQAA